MVCVPSATVTSAGPITGVVVPAAATAAGTVPGSRVRVCSFGLARLVTTAVPPARTSTAGAAAACRTVSLPLPAGIWETSLVNRVAVDPYIHGQSRDPVQHRELGVSLCCICGTGQSDCGCNGCRTGTCGEDRFAHVHLLERPGCRAFCADTPTTAAGTDLDADSWRFFLDFSCRSVASRPRACGAPGFWPPGFRRR